MLVNGTRERVEGLLSSGFPCLRNEIPLEHVQICDTLSISFSRQVLSQDTQLRGSRVLRGHSVSIRIWRWRRDG